MYVEGQLDGVLHFASPGQPDRLPREADPDAEGRLARARTRRSASRRRRARASFSPRRRRCTAIRWCIRSRRATGGNVNPDRAARRVRRGEALRRGDDDGLSPVPRRRHAHRPHLQHLRTAHAAQRRPRRLELHRAGAARRSRSRSTATASQTRTFCYVADRSTGSTGSSRAGRDPANIGNPGEFTVRQLAELVIELTGSTSEIVLRSRFPRTIRRCGSPTSRARASWAGSRRCR